MSRTTFVSDTMEREIASKVYNAIASNGGWLVLDARGVDSYKECHIKGSVCVGISPNNSKTLIKLGGKSPFSSNCWWGKSVVLILPNHDSKKRKRDDHHDQPVLKFLKSEGLVQSLLVLGPHNSLPDDQICTFSSFSRLYPVLMTKSDKTALVSGYPSEILPQFLYLGNMENAKAKSQLDDLKINYVLTIHSERVTYSKSINHIFFDLSDEPTADIIQYFERAYQFLLDAEMKKGRVLVHCGAGVSRSATLCAAFLMRRKKWTVDDTLKYIKERRGQVNPNSGFISALHSYEKKLALLPETNVTETATNKKEAIDRLGDTDSGNLLQLEVQKEGRPIGSVEVVPGTTIIFGRASTCNVILEHASISRQHAKMDVVNGTVILTDMKSTHGTLLNGKPLEKGQSIRLRKFDNVQFGESSRHYILRM